MKNWITRDGRTVGLQDMDSTHLRNILNLMQKTSLKKRIPMNRVRIGKNSDITYLDIQEALRFAKPVNNSQINTEDSPDSIIDMLEI